MDRDSIRKKAQSNYQHYVMNVIPQTNYCRKDRDCRIAIARCPYGCCIYVNRDQLAMVNYLMEQSHQRCYYDCARCPLPVCRNNVCVAENRRVNRFRMD